MRLYAYFVWNCADNETDPVKILIKFVKIIPMPVSDQNILLKIKSAITAVDPSAEVMLFGSRARGDFHHDSDWDVLIIVDKDKLTWEDEKVFRHKLYDIELEIAQPISIFVYSRIDWYGKNSVTPFFESIQEEGKIL